MNSQSTEDLLDHLDELEVDETQLLSRIEALNVQGYYDDAELLEMDLNEVQAEIEILTEILSARNVDFNKRMDDETFE